jgi:hypothetical protein
MKIQVRVQPGASSSKDAYMPDGSIKIWLTSRAHDNEANEGLIKYLSKKFDVAKSRIKILKGETSRNKTVEIL